MEQILYNGEVIKYEVTKKRIKNLYIQVKDSKVQVKAPLGMSDKKIEQFVNEKAKWIYARLKQTRVKPKQDKEYCLKRAKEVYPRLIKKMVAKTNLAPQKWRVRNIKYAWGSCSSNKNITLSLGLAEKKEEVIEYVILHELCHLKYMNHSSDFWKLVESYMPEDKKYRDELKKEG